MKFSNEAARGKQERRGEMRERKEGRTGRSSSTAQLGEGWWVFPPPSIAD